MKTLTAKVIDPTHLELSHPIMEKMGQLIQIVISESQNEKEDWIRQSQDQFFYSYSDEDAIYDRL